MDSGDVDSGQDRRRLQRHVPPRQLAPLGQQRGNSPQPPQPWQQHPAGILQHLQHTEYQRQHLLQENRALYYIIFGLLICQILGNLATLPVTLTLLIGLALCVGLFYPHMRR